MSSKLFILPNKIKFCDEKYHGSFSYTDYNYLKPGLATKIKKRHFEIALKLTSDYFHKVNVIDLGCADGPFLPSLSKHFNTIVGIEYNQKAIDFAKVAVDKQHLHNVSLFCNKNKKISDIKKELSTQIYSIIFLMEVMEHVGNNWKSMYQDKLIFLKEASTLIESNGFIVISVPKMIGLSFLIQTVGQMVFNLDNKKHILNMSLKDFLKCVFLNNTDGLEYLWVPFYTHMGFNHKKFEYYIKTDFEIIKSKSDLFQQIYIIKSKS
ncbi:hypothetical protein ASJ81_14505 [Methanosarcina spelaei]|uniref:Uncharacterized protein n=1 Tax=Methanosarcina spelaei TaxID=1036679 RepID=A0A2A2HY83_9EURY|nr:methyltransferase domain-containing protein [Methanosarcina spelaei]PAV14266.1 hypothetical protein ASJ81_14505 [Methanosarcina spelaei]